MTNYLLWVAAIQTGAYLLYRILLRRETFHSSNRWVLLGSLALSFFIPALPLPSQWNPLQNPEIIGPTITLIDSPTGAWAETTLQSSYIPWMYLLGCIGIGIMGIRGVLDLRKLLKNSKKIKLHHQWVYISNELEAPFSLGKWIFIPENSKESLATVIQHEKIHIDQWHTADLLAFELNRWFLWWSPVSHLLPRLIKDVHEFEVDAKMTQSESADHYINTLLEWSFGVTYPFITHSFSSYNLKKRFDMIRKEKSNRRNYLKLLLVLPFFAMSAMVVSCDKEDVVVQGHEKVEMSQISKFPTFGPDEDMTIEESKMNFSKGIMDFMMAEFKYPEKAKELGLEGKVFVGFTIDQNGNISDINIRRKAMPSGKDLTPEEVEAYTEMETNAMEMVKRLEGLNPAQKDGKNVAIEYTLPVAYKLQ
jgi:TonB family protein